MYMHAYMQNAHVHIDVVVDVDMDVDANVDIGAYVHVSVAYVFNGILSRDLPIVFRMPGPGEGWT